MMNAILELIESAMTVGPDVYELMYTIRKVAFAERMGVDAGALMPAATEEARRYIPKLLEELPQPIECMADVLVIANDSDEYEVQLHLDMLEMPWRVVMKAFSYPTDTCMLEIQIAYDGLVGVVFRWVPVTGEMDVAQTDGMFEEEIEEMFDAVVEEVLSSH